MSSVLYDTPGPRARRRSLIGSVATGIAIAALLVFIVFRVAETGRIDAELWQVYTDPPRGSSAVDVWTSLLINGLGATLRAAAVGGVLALAVGLVLVVLRMAKPWWVRYPATAIIEVFRGLPVILLMFFGVLGLGMPIFQGVVFGLVIYNAAVIGEILRAGIVSLPSGQAEAGSAIGLTQPQILFSILLPQAIRRMLPSLISQFVVLLKDTSLGFIIGYTELLRILRINTEFFGESYLFVLFFVGAAIYIAVNFLLSRLAIWLERRGSMKAAGGAVHADTEHAETHPEAGQKP